MFRGKEERKEGRNLCLAAQTWKKAYETFTDSVIHKIKNLRLRELLGTAENYRVILIIVPNAFQDVYNPLLHCKFLYQPDLDKGIEKVLI